MTKEIGPSVCTDRIIVLYGWKVNVQEQNKIVGELHIPRENFTFRGRSGGQLSKTERS